MSETRDESDGGDALITILLVEDHRVVREGTKELLEHEPDIVVVGEAGTGEEAIAAAGRLRPALAIVDINLPGVSGIEVVRTLSGMRPPVRSMVLSAYDDQVFVTEALASGAVGYLLKTVGATELVRAVRSVASGATVLDQAISTRLIDRWRRQKDDWQLELTPREADVVRLLVGGRSNKEIALELGLSLRTVEGYVSNILTKFGVRSRTEAVVHAISHHLASADLIPPR